MEQVKFGVQTSEIELKHICRLEQFKEIADPAVALSAMGLFNVTYNLLAMVREGLSTFALTIIYHINFELLGGNCMFDVPDYHNSGCVKGERKKFWKSHPTHAFSMKE